MMRSLYAGVTGLRNHQTRMDVIGNNIANVNTIGYKSSRTVFEDIYSQTLRGGGAPVSGAAPATGLVLGGTNPIQIGLGVQLSSIDVMHTQGAPAYTGGTLDCAIQGEGFFVVQNDYGNFYTRAGNFRLDVEGYLTTSDGSFVMGVPYGAAAGTPPVRIKVPLPPDASEVRISESGLVAYIDNTIVPPADPVVKAFTIQLATFANNGGLEKVGGNRYRPTPNSGAAVLSNPGTAGSGTLKVGSLEMSNVDLGSEFTDMIITQRGFQANSRVITTTDTMLEELVNLKR